MKKKTKYILMTSFIGVVLVFGFIYYKKGSGELFVQTGGNKINISFLKNENNKNENKTTTQNNSDNNSAEIKNFTHPDLGFSFNYLSNYVLSKIEDDKGETILLQNNGKGLQIYISNFSARVNFNAEFVKQELSGQKIENVKDTSMPSGFSVVSFLSNDVSLGNTQEVWFVKGGKLYQITTQVGHEELLKKLTETWKFEI